MDDKTGNERQIATDEEVTKITEMLIGIMRESEKLIADAVPQGPMATLIALTTIINELQRCWDFVAGIVIPNCGNPYCSVHGMQVPTEAPLEEDRPTEVDLHDATDAGVNMSEQPMPVDTDTDPDDDIDF